jgi:hypothetical protein
VFGYSDEEVYLSDPSDDDASSNDVWAHPLTERIKLWNHSIYLPRPTMPHNRTPSSPVYHEYLDLERIEVFTVRLQPDLADWTGCRGKLR